MTGNNAQPRNDEPYAHVLPLVAMPHLDRLFDYSIPDALSAQAQPGTRVRVRFAGRLVDGLLVERRRTTTHQGTLQPLQRIISPEIVCPPPMWELVNLLAQRSAGIRADVLRAAIPPRHAAAEKAGLFAQGKPWEELYGRLVAPEELHEKSTTAAEEAMGDYHGGVTYLRTLLAGGAPRASILTLPGIDPAYIAATLAAATVWAPGTAGVLVITPNVKTTSRLHKYLLEWVSHNQITQMTAAETPSTRYRRFLSILHGQGRLVIGTRSAALAPVKNLRLVLVLEDSDDSLVDPRAPYLHARDVAMLRAEHGRTAFATISAHRSAEVQQWVEQKRLESLQASRAATLRNLPEIRALGQTDLQREREAYTQGQRIPASAFHAIRHALQAGQPVLVQVPRRGYAPSVSCAHCRTSARCRICNGPLELHQGQREAPRCRWCGALASNFSCSRCGHHSLRMSIIGQDRTVEELGKAFPSVPIIASGGDNVRTQIPHRASIIVATPGAEPLAASPEVSEDELPASHEKSQATQLLQKPGYYGFYGAAIMLDPWITLGKEDLRAQENAVRQWMHATSLVLPRSAGGIAVLTADAQLPAVQAVQRWEPHATAHAELEERTHAHFPPVATVAAIDGTTETIQQLLDQWTQPEHAELLGPVELPHGVRLPAGLDKPHVHLARRLIVRVPYEHGAELGKSLKIAQAIRSTHTTSGALRVIMNPVRIG